MRGDKMENLHDYVQILKLTKETLIQTSVTLPATAWVGEEAPYIQTIEVLGVTPTNIVLIGTDTNLDNLELAAHCQIVATGQDTDKLTFTAFKDIPETDVTINLAIGGEGKPIL